MHFDSRLWQFTEEVRPRMAFAVVLGLAASAVGIVRLAMLGWLIGLLLGGAGPGDLLLPATLVAGAMLARGALEHWRTMVAHETAARVQLRLRLALQDKLLVLGPGYLTLERTGGVMVSLVEGVEQLEIYFGRYLPQLAVAALSPLLVFALTIWLDVPVALTLLAFAVLTLLAPSLFHAWDSHNARRRQQAYAGFASEFLDALQGLTTLKAFGQSERRGDALAARAHEVFRRTMWVLASNAAARGITDTGLAVGAAAALAVGASRVAAGEMALTTLLMVLMMGIEVFRPQRDLRALLHHGMLGRAAADGIMDVLDAPVPVPPGAGTQAAAIRPAIRFEGVTFSYPNGTLKAHDDLDFNIGEGQRVAFVGASGSGKSTILKLLLRFYDPQAGRVCIGGHDVKTLSAEQLYAQVAVVSQEAFLFHGTVAANLRLARPDASLAQMADAARAANALEYIEALPEGFDTVIGERGVRLSGGQRQRLAIARAVLKDAPILVLDEALSAVDAENEATILAALERLMEGRTTVVFAHRLSSVRRSDEVHVMEGGRIVESGRHDALMARNGAYARLMAAQARESADRLTLEALEPGTVTARETPVAASIERATPAAHVDPSATAETGNAIISAQDGLNWPQALRALLRHVRPWRAKLAATLTLGIARVIALIGVGVLSALAVAALKHGEPYAPYLWWLLLVAPAAGVLHWLESWLAHDMAFRMLAEMRIALYRKIDSLAPAFLIRRRTGDLVAMATHDVELIEYFFAHTIAPAFVAVLIPGCVLAVLAVTGWPMALALAPFLLWVAVAPFTRRSRVDRLGAEAREMLADLNATAVDTLQGLPEIIAFGGARERRKALERSNRDYLAVRLPFFAELSRQDAMLEVATGLGGLAVVLSGSVLVASGQLDPVLLPLLTLLALSSFLPVAEIAQVSRQLAETLGATRRIEHLNALEPAVVDGPITSVTAEARREHPAVRFDQVTFRYPGSGAGNAVENVSFELPRGTTVALVGPSGAGKTTLAHLAMRFWDPEEGRILLEGVALTEWHTRALRDRIALVTQDTFLFNDTLRANIALARPEATDAELRLAIQRAALQDFVATLPDGLETRVGERGMRLSGGQRQRVAIARAFLRDAPVLILDEATSNLDAMSEAHVHEALEALMSDRSTLVIAHRLSTVRRADLIVVMSNGRVAESGSHEALVARGGLYARLVSRQLEAASEARLAG